MGSRRPGRAQAAPTVEIVFPKRKAVRADNGYVSQHPDRIAAAKLRVIGFARTRTRTAFRAAVLRGFGSDVKGVWGREGRLTAIRVPAVQSAQRKLQID